MELSGGGWLSRGGTIERKEVWPRGEGRVACE